MKNETHLIILQFTSAFGQVISHDQKMLHKFGNSFVGMDV